MRKLSAVFLVLGGLAISAPAQPAASALVDDHGVLRWTDSGKEIVQFGVNYTVPFAYSFRAHRRLGIPVTQAIDADVYHLARMGLDAYRVHLWDQEISDAAGNLVVNEHVQAFDYLLAKLKARGFKIILTPLQFGDAGYPEGPMPAGGFSRAYGKQGCLENRAAWPLQERYLAQLVQHVNPFTGLAYRDDPAIIGFEICNEPGHFEYAPTVEYINRMVQAIRGAGCAKPLFYNMSHGIPVAQAYLDANVQGGTFQWYPSNLVAGHEQRGNFLPYLEDYPIPFAENPKFKTKAKIAYEFDTADIGRSYLYPAMARSFRTAGMQFATQFAYDPLYLAAANTEYQTHFLNLAYAPQKALSMMVAAEAFRRVPRFKSYGEYPADTAFEGVRLSYVDDLAELATADKFFYSNQTATVPPAPGRLEHVAGYGRSPIVDYPGQGAYFIDRLDPGVWRLEVMPDAIWMSDPFAKASPKKLVSRIAWNEWPMRIDLPDLGPDYSATGLNDGNLFAGRATDGRLNVRPGAYLLIRDHLATNWKRDDRWANITLKEFVAPPASLERTTVLHTPIVEATEHRSLRVAATIASPQPVIQATLIAYLPRSGGPAEPRPRPGQRLQPGGGFFPGLGAPESDGPRAFAMNRIAGLEFAADIPADQVHSGTLRYFIVVRGPAGPTTFPPDTSGLPSDWDFYGKPWEARIVRAGAPILLFDAARDADQITAQSRESRYPLVPSDQPGSSALDFTARGLDQGEHDESFRFFFKDKIADRRWDLGTAGKIVLYGRSATDAPCLLQVALVTADGIAYGGLVTVRPECGRYAVPIGALAKVRSPNIPHGYPVFLRYWSSIRAAIPLDLTRIESVLVSIGPGLSPAEYAAAHGVQIERIWLE
jgi:hypothetical protein